VILGRLVSTCIRLRVFCAARWIPGQLGRGAPILAVTGLAGHQLTMVARPKAVYPGARLDGGRVGLSGRGAVGEGGVVA